jgi:hypothetical protein
MPAVASLCDGSRMIDDKTQHYDRWTVGSEDRLFASSASRPIGAGIGDTAMAPAGFVGKGDPYAQTIPALKTIEVALVQAGASMADVVRTSIYRSNIEQWQEVGRIHGEIFGSIRPATTWWR